MREEEKKDDTKSHTDRHRKVAEHVGTVQYVVVRDKRLEMHTAPVIML